MERVEVSIICNTYNQEEYIEDTLCSFLSQETSFPFEVLVHDDASTDGTASIIAQYAERYPEIIKPYYEEVNQYSVSDTHNYRVQSARVKGRYIALCEGDDYWTNTKKLQMQFEILERHKELDICVHAGERVHPDTKERLGLVRPKEEDCIIPVEEVILGGGDYVVTNSIFMRAETYVHPPQIVAEFNLDYMIQIAGAMRGGMYYIDTCMAAYRVSSNSSFTSSMLKSRVRTANHLLRVIEALRDLDAQTDYVCTQPIQEHIDELEFRYNSQVGRFGDALRSRTWKTMSLPAKLRSIPFSVYNSLAYRLETMRSK